MKPETRKSITSEKADKIIRYVEDRENVSLRNMTKRVIRLLVAEAVVAARKEGSHKMEVEA